MKTNTEKYQYDLSVRYLAPIQTQILIQTPLSLVSPKFLSPFLLGLFFFSCSSSFIFLGVPLVPALVIPLFLFFSLSFNPPVAVEQLETGAVQTPFG